MTKQDKYTKDEKKVYEIFQTWSPEFNEAADGDMNEYRQYIFDHIKFSKVLRALKLRPEECSTSRYTHRMVCPFKFHKNGRERTGSFRFNDQKQTFTCFGCNESGDILKFLSLFCGGSEQFHLKKLASFAGLLEKTDEWVANSEAADNPEISEQEKAQHFLLKSGMLLRDYLFDIKKHPLYKDECEWADRMFIKLDKYYHEMNASDAEQMFNKLHSSIAKRKGKIGL